MGDEYTGNKGSDQDTDVLTVDSPDADESGKVSNSKFFTEKPEVEQHSETNQDEKKEEAKEESESESKSNETKDDDKEEKPGEEKQSNEQKDDEPNDSKKVTIGGKEYAEDDIVEALEALENKKKWRSENTKNAQENADSKKEIGAQINQIKSALPFVELLGEVNGKSAEEKEEIFETLAELIGNDKATALVKSLNSGESYNPYKAELEKTAKELGEEKGKILLRDQKDALRDKYKLTFKQAGEVEAFARKQAEDSGEFVSIESAYKIMNFGKEGKEKPVYTPPKEKGAQKIVDANKKYDSITAIPSTGRKFFKKTR